jgi:hypothetical protein
MAGSDIERQGALPAIITLVEIKGSIDSLGKKVDEDISRLSQEISLLKRLVYGLMAALTASGVITLPQVFSGN